MAKLRLVAPDGRVFELEQARAYLGRDKSCDVHLQDPSVSRKHVAIEQREGRFYAVDQGSANGTQLDGQRVTEAALAHGQQLKLGTLVLRVELEDELATVLIDPSAALDKTALIPAAVPEPPTPKRPASPRSPPCNRQTNLWPRPGPPPRQPTPDSTRQTRPSRKTPATPTCKRRMPRLKPSKSRPRPPYRKLTRRAVRRKRRWRIPRPCSRTPASVRTAPRAAATTRRRLSRPSSSSRGERAFGSRTPA